MYDPPPGYADLMSDAQDAPAPSNRFHDLRVDGGVGVVRARKPMPNATAALSHSANAKLPVDRKLGYINMFVQNHVADGEFNRLLTGMVLGQLPEDTMQRVTRAISTWGTERPT